MKIILCRCLVLLIALNFCCGTLAFAKSKKHKHKQSPPAAATADPSKSNHSQPEVEGKTNPAPGLSPETPPPVTNTSEIPVVDSSGQQLPEISTTKTTLPEEDTSSNSPDMTRMVFSPTALVRPPGSFSWESSDTAFHDFEYAFSRNVQLDVQMVVPAIYVGIFPSVKFSASLGPHIQGALHLSAGIFWPYLEADFLKSVYTGRFGMAGGGGILTLHWDRVVVNIGLPLYYLRYGQLEFRYEHPAPGQNVTLSRQYFNNYFFAMPNVAIGFRLGSHFKLNFEVDMLTGTIGAMGKAWLCFYGVRYLGRDFYVDLSFMLPILPGLEGLLRTIPVGIPLVSTGMQW